MYIDGEELSKKFGLTPIEAEIFFRIINSVECYEFPSEISLRTHIYNLRRKLKKYNVEIRSVGKGGYMISHNSKPIIDQLSIVDKSIVDKTTVEA